MTKYYTLDGKEIFDGEDLPRQFIQVTENAILGWDIGGEVAKSFELSPEQFAIIVHKTKNLSLRAGK